MPIAAKNYAIGPATQFSTVAKISAYTVSTETNRILVVGAHADVAGAEVNPDSATFGATALTEIGAARLDTGVIAQLWYLINPAAGTRTITVTTSGGSYRRLQVTACYLTNAAPVAPEASIGVAAALTNVSTILSSLTPGSLILTAATLDINAALTPTGSGHVELLDQGSSSLRTWRGELPVLTAQHVFGVDQTSGVALSLFGASFLSGDTTLAPNDTLHVHTVDVATMLPQIVFVPADATHTHSASVPTMSLTDIWDNPDLDLIYLLEIENFPPQ